jgi:hypothetical protein
MSVVFHETLLNILGFVRLPEKALDKYFEIKGDLNLITCNMFFWWGGRVTYCQIFELLNSIANGYRKLHSVPQY